MNVSILGLGKLGMPLAASFATRGIRVIGIDTNPDVIIAVHNCQPLTYEPGLAEAMREAGSMLLATTDVRRAVRDTDMTIILVPTPSREDGSFSLDYVLQACRDLGAAIKECKPPSRYHNVIIASTVMPGSCEGEIWKALEQASGREIGRGLGLCYCPEFVALGNALAGFQHPDFVLIGQNDARAGIHLTLLYQRFCPNDPPIYRTSLINAEIAKIALNFYVTTKISFANAMAELCEAIPGANVDEVTGVLGLDSRIGHKYLKGATGFGGACFPRDVEAMLALFERAKFYPTLPLAVCAINQRQFSRIIKRVEQARQEWPTPNPTLCILGLAFKPNTDVTEGSAGMYLIDWFKSRMPVHVYDPKIRHANSMEMQEAVGRSDIIVVTIPDEKFKHAKFRAGQIVLDCWRLLDRAQVEEQGATYWAIGVNRD